MARSKGAVWPKGYWRGGDMLQRGNAKLSWFWHGDPLTPGVAATADATRARCAIGAHTSEDSRGRDLRQRGGGGESRDERDRGRGPRPCALRWSMDQRLRPIYNVVASLKGREQPDRRMLLGTHHDAWTFGGVDPGTGTAALLEVAKGLGTLAKSGWRPARTIDIAFWDAEEFGLIGSTEYAEQFRAVAARTVDCLREHRHVHGRPVRSGRRAVAARICHRSRTRRAGQRSRQVPIRWRCHGSRSAAARTSCRSRITSACRHCRSNSSAPTATALAPITRTTIRAPMSSRIADPGFEQGVAMVRVLGTLALRMSNADILPFRFADYAERLRQAVGELGGPINEARIAVDDGAWFARIKEIAAVAGRLEAAIDRRLQAGGAGDFAALNDRLARLEQKLADDDGAPAFALVSPRVLRLEYLFALRRPAVSRADRGAAAARCGAREARERAHHPRASIACTPS